MVQQIYVRKHLQAAKSSLHSCFPSQSQSIATSFPCIDMSVSQIKSPFTPDPALIHVRRRIHLSILTARRQRNGSYQHTNVNV